MAEVAAPDPPVAFRSTRMSGDARRQQLIEHAIHLFATLGFRGTTTKAIAQAAGVSEAVIFRHFTTKDELYAAILRWKATNDGLDETIEALKRHAVRGEDEKLVSRLVRHIMDSHQRDPDFQRVMLFAAVEGHDLAKASATFAVPLFGVLRDYVVARQRSGVFRQGDPALMVFGLVALPVHYSIVARLFGAQSGRCSSRRVAEEFTNAILGGLRAAPRRVPRHTRKRKAAGK